ncbi:hypothetical protein ACQ4LE_010680 [Meloidogyne hapla]|uniref:Uncharacterized protein n=1 Tax=Meloidogyne hapla TaxID=6305 RepID=A0A1I8BJ78_MELHA
MLIKQKILKISEEESLFVNSSELRLKYEFQLIQNKPIIEPLINDGNYEFEYIDGEIKEKNNINIPINNNIINNYLFPREIGQISKKGYSFKNNNKWIFYNKKYFKMNENRKYEEFIEEINFNKK